MTETVLPTVLSDAPEPVVASPRGLETFAEGSLVTGRWARGLAVTVGLLVLVAVGLDAVRVSSFVVTGLVTIVITGLLARRWRSQWRRDGYRPGAGAPAMNGSRRSASPTLDGRRGYTMRSGPMEGCPLA